MVAKSPIREKKISAVMNPNLLRETIKKVDKCMERLLELQYTVSGGNKVVSNVRLSPRSTRGYIRTSLACKQESVRLKNATSKRSPVGKFKENAGEWYRMSLPAMLVGETMEEILQASRFAREIVATVSKSKDVKNPSTEPKTPVTLSAKKKIRPQNTDLRSRRMKEKQGTTKSTRLESASPLVKKARSRISLKLSPASKTRCLSKKQNMVAQRVSPRSRPWGKKTVLFPNPVFHSSSPRQDQMAYEIRSPVTARRRQTPHKFLIKSPHSSSKGKVKIKITSATSLSPNKPVVNNSKLKSKNATLASRLRRSFSPSQFASRFVSPLKSRVSSAQKARGLKRGLKQRFVCSPIRSFRKI